MIKPILLGPLDYTHGSMNNNSLDKASPYLGPAGRVRVRSRYEITFCYATCMKPAFISYSKQAYTPREKIIRTSKHSASTS